MAGTVTLSGCPVLGVTRSQFSCKYSLCFQSVAEAAKPSDLGAGCLALARSGDWLSLFEDSLSDSQGL